MDVAIQGELGSFSHEAALTLVPDVDIVPCAAAGAVLEALGSSRVDAAVIPVENSLAGSVMDFYDLFFEHEFVVERELEMRIRHNLIAAPGVDLKVCAAGVVSSGGVGAVQEIFCSQSTI